MDSKSETKRLGALRGRRPWTEQEGRIVVETWEESGDTVPSFAKRAGLTPQRVYFWVKRLGRGEVRRDVLAVPAPAFVPVSVRGASAAATVVASGGVRIEVADLDATSAAWVATLVKALEEVRP